MPTFKKIATATGNGSAQTITFSNIPTTYTDLCILGSTQGVASVDYPQTNLILRRTTNPGDVPYRGNYFARYNNANSGVFIAYGPMGAGGFNLGNVSTNWTTWNQATLTTETYIYIHNYAQTLLQGYNSDTGFTQPSPRNFTGGFSGGIFFTAGTALLDITINTQSIPMSTLGRLDLYGISNA